MITGPLVRVTNQSNSEGVSNTSSYVIPTTPVGLTTQAPWKATKSSLVVLERMLFHTTDHTTYSFNCPKQGKWWVFPSLIETDDGVLLKLVQWYQFYSHRHKQMTGLEPMILPLYMDPSSNTAQVGRRNQDIRELNIPGYPDRPEDWNDEDADSGPAKKALAGILDTLQAR